MRPILPATQEKRLPIKRNAPEFSLDSEQVLATTSLPIKRLVRTEESGPSVQKAYRGRPKKARVETTPSEASQSEASTVVTPTNVGASQQVDEIVQALEYILKNKRPSTELAYRMPLAVWKEYCQSLDTNRFGDDTSHPYTVGPPAKVIAFFNEYVFKKTCTKRVQIGAEVRTQVSLRDEENAGLIDLTEDIPLNKSRRTKKLQVPIGIESVKQYKKALMALHEFQVTTRGIAWPSPKKCKELKNVIQNEISSRIAGFDQQLTQVQQNIQQDLKKELTEFKKQSQLDHQHISRQIEQLHQLLQQSLRIQQMVLTNLNFLTNQQIGSIVSGPCTSTPSSSFSSPPLVSASAPSHTLSSILPTPFISTSFTPTSVPSIASSSRTILPISSQPEIVASNSNDSSKNLKRKYKKKEKATKWVNYSLD